VFVPWALVQVFPHAAQFDAVPSVVSQPAVPEQSAKPALQVPMVQVPVEQDAAAFGNEHAVLQSPQSDSVRVLRSQPLSRSPSQLFQPASHVGEQPLPPQVVVPCGLVQASPQARQFDTVPSVVSQSGIVSQFANPVAHATEVQVPPPHDSLDCGMSHTLPHEPQFAMLKIDVSQTSPGSLLQSSQPVEHVA
jgi:hypothetical protein